MTLQDRVKFAASEDMILLQIARKPITLVLFGRYSVHYIPY